AGSAELIQLRIVVSCPVAEPRGPPGSVGRSLEKLLDLVGPLRGRIVGEELLDLGGGRQRAGQIEAHAAEELSVGAEVRWHFAELAQLLHDQFVDFRRRRNGRIAVACKLRNGPDYRDGNDGAVIRYDDVRVARIGGGDLAVRIDL